MTSTTPRALPTPTERSSRRGRRILWPVGEPADDGYQTYAALEVTHHGRAEVAGRAEYVYIASLRGTSIRTEGPISSERIEFGHPSVLIDREPAQRFSEKRLTAVAAAARAAVETRYAEGDREVIALLGG